MDCSLFGLSGPAPEILKILTKPLSSDITFRLIPFLLLVPIYEKKFLIWTETANHASRNASLWPIKIIVRSYGSSRLLIDAFSDQGAIKEILFGF